MFGKEVDARSAPARRLRDLILDYAKPLGGYGALSEADAALVREAAAKTTEAEAMQAKLANGEAIDPEQSVRISNVLSRLLAQLERRRKALGPRQKTLAEHLAERAAKGAI